MDRPSFDQKPSAPRKMRFQPKAPVRKAAKPAVVKTEVVDDAETAQAKDLMQRFQDGLAAKPKVEKKSEPVQRVAFGYGSSVCNNNFNASYETNSRRQDKPPSQNKEYKEPWNYYSYYPTTLPLRRPYSGDPDVLDSEEFEQQSKIDESLSNSAMKLGLMEESSEPKMMFFQLPKNLPMKIRLNAPAEQAPATSSKEPATSSEAPATSSKAPSVPDPIEKNAEFKDLQPGCMGKMLVYKSGAVKMKLGDTLYDVTPGSASEFAQDVVAINTEEKHFCVLGELSKRAVVSPDVKSILDSVADLG